jgi:pimeloyl-ACP methyl ester carboxylesterase
MNMEQDLSRLAAMNESLKEAPTFDADEDENPLSAGHITEDCIDEYQEQIKLHSLSVEDGRTVQFATAGDDGGSPVLFWYAGGCNRRILCILGEAAEQCGLKFICLNRPGRCGTSPTLYTLGDTQVLSATEGIDEPETTIINGHKPYKDAEETSLESEKVKDFMNDADATNESAGQMIQVETDTNYDTTDIKDQASSAFESEKVIDLLNDADVPNVSTGQVDLAEDDPTDNTADTEDEAASAFESKKVIDLLNDADVANISPGQVNLAEEDLNDNTADIDIKAASIQGSTHKHMKTCIADAISVLNSLNLDKVGILFQCAGTPFALTFAAQHPERIADVPMVGLSSWVQPADCPETKKLFQFGARKCPSWLMSPLSLGMGLGSLETSPTWIPIAWVASKFHKSLAESEKKCFDVNFELDEFVTKIRWMQQEGTGTPRADLSCLMTPAMELGLDFQKLTCPIKLMHAQQDRMAPMEACEWLASRLPNCELIKLEDATHEGILFLLHSEIEQALKCLNFTD